MALAPQSFPSDEATPRRAWLYAMVLVCVLFGAVVSLIKPFVSNQNTYLVHAALKSGAFPSLESDWFASTRDPTPAFSVVCSGILSIMGTFGLQLTNALLGALFLAGLVGCGAAMTRSGSTPSLQVASAMTLCVLWFGLPGVPARVLFEGVAEQYLFRGFLQPSSFGVLLLWALWGFATRRTALGLATGAIAVWMSPSYLMAYACLLLGAELFRPLRRAGAVLGLGIVAVLPVVFSSLLRFSPSDPASFAEACRILVEQRMPHHADPRTFLSWSLLAQVGLFGIALRCARREASRALLVMAGLGASLTILTLWLGDHCARLAFPWRISTLIAPVVTALIVCEACAFLGRHVVQRRSMMVALAIVDGLLTTRAAWAGFERIGGSSSPEVALARSPLALGAQPAGGSLIPPEWGDIRLNAGRPVFVDWKSHPYRDLDVLEWWGRVQLARAFYRADDDERCSILRQILIVDAGVRWILAPTGFKLDCPGVRAHGTTAGAAFSIDTKRLIQ